MQLLQDSVPLVPSLMEGVEEIPGGKLRGTAKFQHCGVVNRNNRCYPQPVWEQHCLPESAFQASITRRAIFGHLEHPSSGKPDLKQAAIIITNVHLRENGEVWGTFETMSTTAGKEAAAMIRDGLSVGISSRAHGSVRRRPDGVDEVQEDFKPLTFDLVAEPSTPGAEIQLAESLEAMGEEAVRLEESRAICEVQFQALCEEIKRGTPDPTLECRLNDLARATKKIGNPMMESAIASLKTALAALTGERAVKTRIQQLRENAEAAAADAQAAAAQAEAAAVNAAQQTHEEDMTTADPNKVKAEVAAAKAEAAAAQATAAAASAAKATTEQGVEQAAAIAAGAAEDAQSAAGEAAAAAEKAIDVAPVPEVPDVPVDVPVVVPPAEPVPAMEPSIPVEAYESAMREKESIIERLRRNLDEERRQRCQLEEEKRHLEMLNHETSMIFEAEIVGYELVKIIQEHPELSDFREMLAENRSVDKLREAAKALIRGFTRKKEQQVNEDTSSCDDTRASDPYPAPLFEDVDFPPMMEEPEEETEVLGESTAAGGAARDRAPDVFDALRKRRARQAARK